MEPLELKEAVRGEPVRVGRYEVLGLIGEGGMGDVYDAIDTEHGGRVALKTLRGDLDPERLLLFKNEFRAVADLAHKNLIPLYELGHHDGLWFFTMERVDGVGLAHAIRRTTDVRFDTGSVPLPLPTAMPTHRASPRARSGARKVDDVPATPAEAPLVDLDLLVATVAQILDALEYLHQQGVVHQDLKPSNILIDAGGTVRLLDFGLAHRIGQSMVLSRQEAVIGTPDYMAPELFDGQPASPASDLFALGCVMFQLLAGHPPGIDTQTHARRTTRVERVVHGVPDEVADICARMLAAAPDARPSIAEVREALGVTRGVGADPSAPVRFVGRARELETLRDALARARDGANVIARVEGGSGAGKSALVRSFLGGLQGRDDVLVLRGRCYERESVPYKAFDGMIDALAVRLSSYGDDELEQVLPPWFDELTLVFPVLGRREQGRAPDVGSISAQELRRRVLEALYRLFVQLAGQQPLVLEIDDLQWADADSVALLARLLREPPDQLLIALLVRPDEAGQNADVARYLDAVTALPSQRKAVIEIGPLAGAEAEDLARQTLRSLGMPETLAGRIAAESGGVPFFVEELAHSVAQQGDAEEAAVRLDHALAERARALSGPERALVEVLAVANNPIPRSAACEAAGLEGSALAVLAALHRGRFVQSAGVRADDRLGIYHDRMRESMLAYLSEERTAEIHLALGRALAKTVSADAPGPWLFDAARHSSAARSLLVDRDERLDAARLHALAGFQARQAAAYPLAFRCFEDGIALLPDGAWDDAYDTCLRLHAGAAEAAYLTATWPVMEQRIAEVKERARSVLDQMAAWVVQIDALTGNQDYLAAIDAGLEILALLGVDLPRDPDEAAVGAAFERAFAGLTELGTDGIAALPDVEDDIVLAAMRIQVRLCPVAFFARQRLLALIASNLVTTSIERGASYATPNALALFGLVANAGGMYPVSHAWGELAIDMIERWEDRSLEAATRHVVFNFVCPWVVPVHTILASSREVFDIGQRTGDFEYGSYAIHTYTYMAMAAGRPLEPLRDDVLALGQQMRAFGQFNAVHIHAPFEQLLTGLTGVRPDPWSLDDAQFREEDAIAAAVSAGTRSGLCVQHVAIGMARFYFGRYRDASHHLESARPLLDSVPSCWLVPLCHQFAALAGCAAWGDLDEDARTALRPRLDESLAELRTLAAHGPANFDSRVSTLEGELARIDGDLARAAACFARAIEQAAVHDATGEIGLGHQLLSRALQLAGQMDEAARHLDAARRHYGEWGAHALVAHLADRG